MAEVLLDTDIFSEALKRKDLNVSGRASSYLARYGRFTLSAITVMEVVAGLCRRGAHRQMEMLLLRLGNTRILPVDNGTATLAGRIDGALSKVGARIGSNDVLIGAAAIQLDLTLVTGNLGHYRRIAEVGFPLRLDNWREPVAGA